jgi:hypothetical protein
MKRNWLSKIIRTPVAAALVLVLATVTMSTAASSRATSKTVKRGQVHFEYVVPHDTQRASGWYQPARSPQFSSFLH